MKKNINKKINIGIVCSSSLGGSGVVGSELAKYLAKNGKYKVVYIGLDLPFRLGRNDVIFHKVKAADHALFNHPLREVALVEGIIEAVIEHKISIIHAHFAIPFAYSALQAREILRKMGIDIKVVTTLHGTDVLSLGLELPGTMKYILEQSNAVTAVSTNLARLAKEIYHTRRSIQVIYNFIDSAPNRDRKDYMLLREKVTKSNKKIFMHISNFRPVKKIIDTIKVFSKVNKEIPSVLLLLGDGPEVESAKKFCKALDCRRSIYFVGMVKNPYQYLKIADGLIVTSEYESFCLAGLEALSFGVAVFSTAVGGIPEVIKHEKSGYLVKQGDTITLSKYIIRHFSDTDIMCSMRAKAKERAEDFVAEKIIPKYESIYQQLLLSQTDRFFQSVS